MLHCLLGPGVPGTITAGKLSFSSASFTGHTSLCLLSSWWVYRDSLLVIKVTEDYLVRRFAVITDVETSSLRGYPCTHLAAVEVESQEIRELERAENTLGLLSDIR